MNKDVITNLTEHDLILDLGMIPFVNNLESSFEESINSKKIPLSIIYFTDSKVTRIKDIPNTNELFDQYLYLSGVNEPFKVHCSQMYDWLVEKGYLKDYDCVVDIGGNDGTLLYEFSKKNSTLSVLNIEPSNIYINSKQKGLKTVNKYFDKSCISDLEEKPNLIVTTNVFQHLYDIKEFAENICEFLQDNGYWCLEFPYWINTMKTMQFDQIYHEHIYYYNVHPLNLLFSKTNLKIVEVSNQFIHGGSLRLIISKKVNKIEPSTDVQKILLEESKIDFKFYTEWENKLRIHLDKCKEEILNLSNKNRICGFGAAAKGIIFLNFLKLDYKTIEYVIDDTNIKQNKFIPGTGIKVVSRKQIDFTNIDYILILAHNFSDYIMDSLRKDGYKNKFIICLPEFKIL
jgi:trans-aconitate methyltransferase